MLYQLSWESPQHWKQVNFLSFQKSSFTYLKLNFLPVSRLKFLRENYKAINIYVIKESILGLNSQKLNYTM